VFGNRRYETTDDSKNNWFLALLTMGEGWHNNHHHYQSTANQGFYWWEVDMSYYILCALARVGLVWDLRKPPQRVLEEGLSKPKQVREVATVEVASVAPDAAL
jgi:stearoyl-CoA desaturase (delta-9 desaturase)